MSLHYRSGLLLGLFACFLCAMESGALAQRRSQNQHFITWPATQNNTEVEITNASSQDTGNLRIFAIFPHRFAKQSGYVPLKFRVIPSRNSTFRADSTLRISIGNIGYTRFGESNDQAHTVVEIPLLAGEREASGAILANCLTISNQKHIECSLDGRMLPGQEAQIYDNYGSTEISHILHLISEETAEDDAIRSVAYQNLKESGRVFDYEYGSPTVNQPPAYMPPRNTPQPTSPTTTDLAFCDVRNMPTNWLELSYLLKITIDARDLERLDNAGRLLLNQYVMAGGWLEVYNASSRADIERHLRVSLAAEKTKVTEQTEDAGPAASENSTDSQTDQIRAIALIENGFGKILVRPTPKPVAKPSNAKDPWSSQLTKLSTTNLPANQPTAVLAPLANRADRFDNGVGNDFWNWLIPSVGRTPVVPFLAIVVIFAGILVPGIMYWATKNSRRVWILILMPSIAMLATVLLFAYGMIKDGVGAVGRCRSLTILNADGDGIVWSRQTYFAATRPGTVSFGPTTQVVPLTSQLTQTLPAFEQQDENGQQTYRGLIPPRTQSQFFVLHPVNMPQSGIRDKGPEGALDTIENKMSTSWELAIFCDRKGKCYEATNVLPNTKPTFREIDADKATKLLRAAYLKQPLESPIDAPDASQRSLAEIFRGRNYYYYGYSADNVLEELFWQRYVGTEGSLELGTFVIFTQEAPHLERCLTYARGSQELHTIVGSW